MVNLETREQALGYLEEIFPSRTYQVFPMDRGWICTPVLTSEETQTGKAVGLGRIVLDAETGTVTGYPSWPVAMVANAHVEARRTGQPKGQQLYPHRWRITMRRLQEDSESITYSVRVLSLKNPAEPPQEYPLTINKHTLVREPTDTLASVATSYAEWSSRQNQGIWPEEATTEV